MTADQLLAKFDAHATQVTPGERPGRLYEATCSCGWRTPWPSSFDVTNRYEQRHRLEAIGWR